MATPQNRSTAEPAPSKKWAALALGFRPFFLLSVAAAIVLMLLSVAGFTADFRPQGYFDLPLWHAHEMLFGYATAVVAGFLLTSVRNWTGLPTPTGTPLLLLALLWLAPRLLSFVPLLPAPVFALLDMLFLPTLAIILARLIRQAGQPHNYPIPLLLIGMALCNGSVHLYLLGWFESATTIAIQLAACMIIGLIIIIGGRVVPFFMQGGIGQRPDTIPWVEKAALPSLLLFALSIISDLSWLIMITALVAAVIHTARLYSWCNRKLLTVPMLWVLIAGYAWLVAGLFLYAIALWLDLSIATALHAWTIGAIGMFTLGMMTRVALGHTGRTIEPLPWISTAFALLFIAALVRTLLPLIWPQLLEISIIISAGCWITAFVIVAIRYTMILLTPRPDGKPG